MCSSDGHMKQQINTCGIIVTFVIQKKLFQATVGYMNFSPVHSLVLLSYFFHNRTKRSSLKLVQDVFNFNTGLKEFLTLLLVIVTTNTTEKGISDWENRFLCGTRVPCLEGTPVIFLLCTVSHVLYHHDLVLKLLCRLFDHHSLKNVDQTIDTFSKTDT